MLRRSLPGGNPLRVVSPRREAVRSIAAPAHVPSIRRERPVPCTGDPPEGDRRLTLVLGLLARADGMASEAHRTAAGRRSHADRTIAVNRKLKEASLSAIEAAQVLADTCFCQSHEAVVLDRVLGVIDELDDAIRALHEPERRPPHSGPKTQRTENAQAAFRRVFVPAGRGSIFRLITEPARTDEGIGGTAMRAEDAEKFLAALIGGSDGESPSLTTVCRAATRLLRMSGSSVVLMGEDTFPSVASAYGVSVTVQDLEFTLGEGPAIDAFAQGKPILVGDISLFGSRWPQFSRAISEAGIHSMYALPLQLGAIKLGVLVLYRDEPGLLEGEDLSAALLVADLVTNQVLDMQAGALSESLAWGLEVDDYRAVVHQATGMISAQLDCPMGEALVRLRGRAFSREQPIDLVAAEVVTGDVRFDEP
jgi:GAF domain